MLFISDCDKNLCDGWTFIAKAFYGQNAQFCWVRDDSVILGCEESSNRWVQYKNHPAPDTKCHGNFTFFVDTVQYSLSGTYFNGPGDYDMSWYLARLRPQPENKGWFYCSAKTGQLGKKDNETRVFFYNGTYYDVSTDSNGFIQKTVQVIKQNQLILYADTIELPGCQTGCCWIQDVWSPVDGRDNRTSLKPGQITEFVYKDGEFKFLDEKLYKEDPVNGYLLYDGIPNKGISKCLARFQTDYKWNEFIAVDGTIFQVTGDEAVDLEPNKNTYLQMLTSGADAEGNGTFYIEIEEVVYMFENSTKTQLVAIENGQIIGLPIDAKSNETDKYFKSQGSQCGNTTCSGVNFQNSSNLFCLSRTYYFLSVCNEELGVFMPVPNSEMPNTICWGNFEFKIGETQYMLNETVVMRKAGAFWVVASNNSFDYAWYFSRLRPLEGTGFLFCYQNDIGPFYYDGSAFFTPSTNSLGFIQFSKMFGVLTRSYFFVNWEEPVCKETHCCWFSDVYPVTATKDIMTEIHFNGRTFQAWVNNTWVNYRGEFNAGILRCSKYLSNINWRTDFGWNATWFMFKHNKLYERLYDGTVLSQSQIPADLQNIDIKDPLATGGFYFSNPAIEFYFTGKFRNITGEYNVDILNGHLRFKKTDPFCGQPAVPTACLPTEDIATPWRHDRTPCNPFSGGNTCGPGFICQPVEFENTESCSHGFCVPNYNIYCKPKATTTTSNSTTPAPEPLLKRYGSPCSENEHCLTGICISGVCSCTNCTKYYPYFHFNRQKIDFEYRERCIRMFSCITLYHFCLTFNFLQLKVV